MSTSSLPSSQPVNDSNFFTALMPNQGRTRFVRCAILLFLGCGALAWIVIAVRTFSEFHARHSWPVAQGRVTAVKVKSYTGPSSRDHVSHYFVEYEVRFAVPAEQCLAGTTFVIDREPHYVGESRARVPQIPRRLQTLGGSAIVSILPSEFCAIRMDRASRLSAKRLPSSTRGEKSLECPDG